MEEFDAGTYGDLYADRYDDWYPEFEDAGACLGFLRTLVDEGATILELGAGTGRVALPLAAAGFEVIALDGSARMLEVLAEKEGAEAVQRVEADLASFEVDRHVDVVLCVFNTFFQLQSQEAQIQSVASGARALRSGGWFILEVWLPDFERYRHRGVVEVTRIGRDGAELDLARHDPVRQLVEGQTIGLGVRGISARPLRIRYAWPSELDLMARLAGLEFHARYTDWVGADFTASSTQHVSVYRKP